jgi:hypothetical protein
LVSIRENLVRILYLIGYKLVEFSAFELHLLFEILLFDLIISAFFIIDFCRHIILLDVNILLVLSMRHIHGVLRTQLKIVHLQAEIRRIGVLLELSLMIASCLLFFLYR